MILNFQFQSNSFLNLVNLYRAVCGIRDKTLIINFPGSKKAVVECFEAISSVLPHAIELICDLKTKTVATHEFLQKDFNLQSRTQSLITASSMTVSSKASEESEIADLLETSSSSMEEVSLYFDLSFILKTFLVLPDNPQRSQHSGNANENEFFEDKQQLNVK